MPCTFLVPSLRSSLSLVQGKFRNRFFTPMAEHWGDVDRLHREAPSDTLQSYARPRRRGGAGYLARRFPCLSGSIVAEAVRPA